jgi:hypothetical protein
MTISAPSSTRLVIWCSIGMLAAIGCGDTADLPAGWQAAEHIEDFEQAPCGGSALGGVPETITAAATTHGLRIDYAHAHFRCAQDVEGFVRRSTDTIDVLVQPVDMSPAAPVRCDCLYDVVANVRAAPGSYALTVYRRWDNVNQPNAPSVVDVVDVAIP